MGIVPNRNQYINAARFGRLLFHHAESELHVTSVIRWDEFCMARAPQRLQPIVFLPALPDSDTRGPARQFLASRKAPGVSGIYFALFLECHQRERTLYLYKRGKSGILGTKHEFTYVFRENISRISLLVSGNRDRFRAVVAILLDSVEPPWTPCETGPS
jgi:hypothetical protein